MPDYTVEIVVTKTYKITAVDQQDAEATVLVSYPTMDAIDEHVSARIAQEAYEVSSCAN